MTNPLKWFYIPTNVPSLKNNKEIITIPLKGQLHIPKEDRKTRAMLVPSKRHQKYEKSTAIIYRSMAHDFRKLCMGRPKPYIAGFYFVRDSKRLFDYGNAITTCEDIMETRDWIDNDNCMNIKSIPLGHHVDKVNCGVWITLLPDDLLDGLCLPEGEQYPKKELTAFD